MDEGVAYPRGALSPLIKREFTAGGGDLILAMEDGSGAPRLVLREGPVPVPLAQEVLVKITAASLNHRDVARMSGATPAKLPLVPGSDAAGVVHAVGPGVTRWRPGDRVMTLLRNAGSMAHRHRISAKPCSADHWPESSPSGQGRGHGRRCPSDAFPVFLRP